LLSERLEALLARSADWVQRLRLAYPDGSLLPEPIGPSLTVGELVSSELWRKAEAAAAAREGQVATPTRSRLRSDSRAREVEQSLRRLQEAKNLPLNSKAAKGPALDAAPPAPAACPERGANAAAAATVADPASKEAGGQVLLVSSLDGAHPGENVIDGSDRTYWLSTGLYPQEILLELGRPSRVAGVRLASTNVRGLRIEGCSELAAARFETLATVELEAAAGQLQRKELACKQQATPTRFVKTMILSGWHDFCSVHQIVVVE